MTASTHTSFVCGATDQTLLHLTLDGALRAAVAAGPERTALIARHQGVRLSYAELDAAVEAVAAGLIRHGLQPGDRLGIWSPNNAEWVVTMFAAARAGLVLVNLNPAYRITEIEGALRQSGCRALLIVPAFRGSDYTAILRTLMPELDGAAPGALHSARLPELRLLVQIGADAIPGFMRYAELTRPASAAERAALAELGHGLDPDAPFNIQFTSGTTGTPKGATLSHFSLVNNGFFVGERMRFTPADVVCIPVPLFHCFGMVLGVLAAVTHGACSVLSGDYFEPGSVLEAVAAERCTALYGVPTMFIAVLGDPRFAATDVRSLRTGIMAGAPCPVAVMRRVVDELHMPEVTICYGMTETSPVSFQSFTDDPLEQRVGSVGRVHPHLQVKLVDADGIVVPRGAPGELCTRGYSVMRGYWGDEERTRAVLDAAGWMHTGDLAEIDAEGYCRIVGRVKDMIIRGGENISPREIEEYLYRHPAVLDVAVVGIPDERFGEEVCACILLKAGASATAEGIRDFCREQIAHYKIPRHVRFLREFPLTVTGKIQKYLLREQMRRELLGA
ncbi:MAG: AMP-binding protein [Steroidobacteraceae bacterium]